MSAIHSQVENLLELANPTGSVIVEFQGGSQRVVSAVGQFASQLKRTEKADAFCQTAAPRLLLIWVRGGRSVRTPCCGTVDMLPTPAVRLKQRGYQSTSFLLLILFPV